MTSQDILDAALTAAGVALAAPPAVLILGWPALLFMYLDKPPTLPRVGLFVMWLVFLVTFFFKLLAPL